MTHEREERKWHTGRSSLEFAVITGYLKLTAMRMERNAVFASLAVLNEEVRSIYENSMQNWFRDGW